MILYNRNVFNNLNNEYGQSGEKPEQSRYCNPAPQPSCVRGSQKTYSLITKVEEPKHP